MHSLQTQQAAAAVKAAMISLLLAVKAEYQLPGEVLTCTIAIDHENTVEGDYEMGFQGDSLGGGSL